MAKQTPEEKFVSKVQAKCLETGVHTPSGEATLEDWRETLRHCNRVAARQAAKDKAVTMARLTSDRSYRSDKRKAIRANAEDRLTVQTEMAETLVLAKLQRERIEDALREKLGMAKKSSKTEDSQTSDVQTSEDSAESTDNAVQA